MSLSRLGLFLIPNACLSFCWSKLIYWRPIFEQVEWMWKWRWNFDTSDTFKNPFIHFSLFHGRGCHILRKFYILLLNYPLGQVERYNLNDRFNLVLFKFDGHLRANHARREKTEYLQIFHRIDNFFSYLPIQIFLPMIQIMWTVLYQLRRLQKMIRQ